MDELTIHEIVRGIVDESMKDQRLALLQLLSNKLGESLSALTESEATAVFTVAVKGLKSDLGESLVEVMLGILTNATITEDNAQSFISYITGAEKQWKQFADAIEEFLNHNPQLETDTLDDAWSHMGSVLCNLCQVEGGRKLIVSKSAGYMPRLLCQVRTQSFPAPLC